MELHIGVYTCTIEYILCIYLSPKKIHENVRNRKIIRYMSSSIWSGHSLHPVLPGLLILGLSCFHFLHVILSLHVYFLHVYIYIIGYVLHTRARICDSFFLFEIVWSQLILYILSQLIFLKISWLHSIFFFFSWTAFLVLVNKATVSTGCK